MACFFKDIGKSANDLLSKDYTVGAVKLDAKTTAVGGTTFKVTGSQDVRAGGITAEMKFERKEKARGLTISESWDTANNIKVNLELADTLTKGLKLTAGGGFSLQKGSKETKVGVEYNDANIASKNSLDLFKGPAITSDFVVGRDGILFGVETGLDVSRGTSPTKYNFALGYSLPEYAIACHLSNKTDTVSASYFHKVSYAVEAGGKASWERKSDNIHFEFGTKYTVDKDLFMKAKIDSHGRLGLGLTQTLRPGVKVNFAGVLDTAKLGENTHRVGLGLTLEA